MKHITESINFTTVFPNSLIWTSFLCLPTYFHKRSFTITLGSPLSSRGFLPPLSCAYFPLSGFPPFFLGLLPCFWGILLSVATLVKGIESKFLRLCMAEDVLILQSQYIDTAWEHNSIFSFDCSRHCPIILHLPRLLLKSLMLFCILILYTKSPFLLMKFVESSIVFSVDCY